MPFRFAALAGRCACASMVMATALATSASAAETAVPSPLRLADRPSPHEGATALALDAAAYAALNGRESLRVNGFILNQNVVVDLDLTRLEIFSDDATIVVGHPGKPMQRPEVAFFRGTIADRPGSSVFLSLSPHGSHGWIKDGQSMHILSSGPHGADDDILIYDPAIIPAELIKQRPFTCQAEELPGYRAALEQLAARPAQGGVAGEIVQPTCRLAHLAIETDHEFTANLFGGNTDAAAAYAATLIAAASEIFVADVSTRLDIVFLRLWETPDDPWTAGSTGQQLNQFQDFWINNMADVERTAGHFLSGRGLGGGVAWLGTLCDTTFGYALSADLGGSFPYPLIDHNGQNWDVIVVAHELGHNFGTPHTHDFNPPVDTCAFGGCDNAAEVGTIMSYCHTCPGGLANIALTLHPVPSQAIMDYLGSGLPCNLFDSSAAPSAVADSALTVPDVAVAIDILANDAAANCVAISLAQFPSVSSAGGSIVLSPGTGTGGLDELLYTPAPSFAGFDSFTYTIADENSLQSEGTVTINVATLRAPENPILADPGVTVDYYHLADPVVLPDFNLLTSYSSQIEAQINFPSTGGVFAGSGEADNFGAVYTGYLAVPVSGFYTLYVNSDDGSKLFIGDELVVNNDGLHPMVEIAGTIGLQAGVHAMRVEFFERGGGAGVIVSYEAAGLAKQVVPASQWSHDGSADLTGDGVVDGADLGSLLLGWGRCAVAGIEACAADFNHDGVIDGADLGLLLLNWS